MNQIIKKSEELNFGVKFISETEPKTVIANINKEINQSKQIGGNDEIIRILTVNDQQISLQTYDNGTTTVYWLLDEYPYKQELFKKVKILCEVKNLIFTPLGENNINGGL